MPIRLAGDLMPHDVSSVRRRGWTGAEDDELLRRAAREFDAFPTVDQSLEHQQAIPASLILLTLVSRSIEYPVLRELIPQLLERLERAHPGDAIPISALR